VTILQFVQQSSTWANLVAGGTNVWISIFKSWAPDLIIVNVPDDTSPDAEMSWFANIHEYLPNTDMAVIGLYDYNYHPSIENQNAVLRDAARTNGYAYFDSYSAMGNTNNMFARGWSSTPDGPVHLTPSGCAAWADLIWSWLDLDGGQQLIAPLNNVANIGSAEGIVTNNGIVWISTNLATGIAPSTPAPNGSILTATNGAFYVRSNGVWVLH